MEATDKLTPRERELLEDAARRQRNTIIALGEAWAIHDQPPGSLTDDLATWDSAVAKVRRLIGA